jgi:hypothetical protein
MGLDMYLQRSKEMSDKAFSDAFEGINSGVIYWRKANAIHNFFCSVGTLDDDGEEDIGYYDIDRQDLMNLLDRIHTVLSDKLKSEEISYYDIEKGKNVTKRVEYKLNISAAEDLLPTKSGFFFGDTDYDYWYAKDLETTAQLIKEELNAVPSQKTWFYYASW